MTQFIPTKNQRQALEKADRDVLVSAAAGSGKTTVLVEHIIEQLFNGQDLDHLLIVTFTEAAAQEMKQRLTHELQSRTATVTDTSKRQHLYRQLALIPSAYISTLHAFCLRVIRKFYYLRDVDPNFRLLSDDNERFLLKERAWQKLRTAYYQAEDEDFFLLEDNFVGGSDDSTMADLLFHLTDFATTTPDPKSWIESLPLQYQVGSDITQTDFYQQILQRTLINNVAYLQLQVQKAQDTTQTYDELAAYQTSLQQLNEQIQNLQQNLPNLKWDDLRLLVLDLPTISGRAKPKTDPHITQPFLTLKKNITSQLQELQYKLFALDNQQWQKILQGTGHLVTKLVEVAQRFLQQFQTEKSLQHSLDFNDLEHQALTLLQTQKGGHQVAQEYYQQQFQEILIDEYQDTNPLQETIIQLIRRRDPGNLFMVGDIKQSIYGFRQAAPQLFVHKYQQMQSLLQTGKLINLSENFRSAPNVIQTINEIFTRIMDQDLGDMNYDAAAKLVSGTQFPEDLDTTTEVIINQENLQNSSTTNEQEEIKLIIDRIQQLFAQDYQIFDRHKNQKRPLKYSDIAILTRVKSLNNDVMHLFAQAHLPVIVTDAANYFQATEVQVILSLLKIIDNPRQDIALVAVLRSMIGGLNENELAYLRINSRTGDYYQALLNYLADSDYNQKNKFAQNLTVKVRHFMEQLDSFRQQAPKMSIAELIWQIYLKTGYLSYVQGMPNGRQRAANLHALYQRADQFERMEFKGLFQFIHFIEHIQNNKQDLGQPMEYNQASDQIQVMTIHASKGLEFPLVFVLNIDHHFNNEDSHKRYLLDSQTGIGVKYLDPTTHILYETLPLYAIKAKQKKKVISEEMRLLYVALTRAQQKLILVGATKKTVSAQWSEWQLPQKPHTVIDTALRNKFNSFQTMLQYILGLNGQLQDNKVVAQPQSPFDFQVVFQKAEPKIAVTPTSAQLNEGKNFKPTPIFQKTVQQVLNFAYSHQEATRTTAYQSVSEIKHLFASPDDQNLPVVDWQQQHSRGNRYTIDEFARPRFLATAKVAVNAADIGSATHLLLQKISLQSLAPTTADFKQLAHQLVQQQILTAAVAQKIDYQSLGDFYQSQLGKNILKYRTSLKREWAFSMLLPAKRLFNQLSSADDDQILIHGIIDGLFKNDQQQIIIFDYKTDYLDPSQATGPHSVRHALQEYSGQLNLYQQAVEQIAQQKVIHKYLCFLSINQVVEVK